jgi:chromosome segregation ATPase
MVDKANDAAAALGGAGGKKMMFHGQEVVELNPDQEAKFREKVAPIEKELQGLAARDEVLRGIAKRRADELARLEAARKSAAPGTDEFKRSGEAAETARTDLARVNQEIRDIAKAMTDLENKGFELRKSFLAGDRWIDTTQFEDAKKKIEKDAAEVAAAMDEIDRAEREARASRDKGRLDEAAKERKALQERLKMLVERANATEEAASSEWDVLARARAALEAQHVAPRPHMVGARAQAQIGDAARGVFQSADFRGALSLGPVSETAKQALDITKIIAGKIDTTNKLLADQNSFWGKGIPTPMDKDPVSFWH